MIDYCLMFSGEYVEDAFLKTAQIIYECIQDGRYVIQNFFNMKHLFVNDKILLLNNYFFFKKKCVK